MQSIFSLFIPLSITYPFYFYYSGVTMRILVVGCLHGELERLYEVAREIEASRGQFIDLIICCGDFQAVRNPADMRSLNVPPKYAHLQSFYKYCINFLYYSLGNSYFVYYSNFRLLRNLISIGFTMASVLLLFSQYLLLEIMNLRIFCKSCHMEDG